MRTGLISGLVLGIGLWSSKGTAQRNVSVPSTCTPQVNAKLQKLVHDQPNGYVENVMACGVAVGTRVNHGGPHGSHHIITVNVKLPEDGPSNIQVAINDALDGVVSAKAGATVFAYGQAYVTSGAWVAGVHDVHCSTHPSADNGWVVVNAVKMPKSCPVTMGKQRAISSQ